MISEKLWVGIDVEGKYYKIVKHEINELVDKWIERNIWDEIIT